MMGRGRQSFKKRQKEQQEQIAKRLERKLQAKKSTVSEQHRMI
jgi:hypothetical protein